MVYRYVGIQVCEPERHGAANNYNPAFGVSTGRRDCLHKKIRSSTLDTFNSDEECY